MNEETCTFNHILASDSESYYNKLKKKAEIFTSYFRVNCSVNRTCDRHELWKKIQRESVDNYDMLQLYKLQLYLPESIWEINSNVTTTRLK